MQRSTGIWNVNVLVLTLQQQKWNLFQPFFQNLVFLTPVLQYPPFPVLLVVCFFCFVVRCPTRQDISFPQRPCCSISLFSFQCCHKGIYIQVNFINISESVVDFLNSFSSRIVIHLCQKLYKATNGIRFRCLQTDTLKAIPQPSSSN